MTARPVSLRVLVSAFFIFSVLFGLGVWQVQRLAWKNSLIQHLDDRLAADVRPLPEAIEDPAAWEYRRVTVAGHYLHDKALRLGPRVFDGQQGYHLIVPLRRASGGIVFINRGWISDALMPKADRPGGLVQVEGVVRLPHRDRFVPDNNAVSGAWYWPDLDAMAEASGLESPLPVLLVSTRRQPDAWPIGLEERPPIRNDHLQYAVFWFGMAGIFCVICGLSLARRRRA